MMKQHNSIKRLEIYSGGYGGSSFSLEKDDVFLLYKTYGNGYSLKNIEKIAPSPRNWEKFINVLDQIDIWNWKPRYENPDILDGSSWRVVIEFGDIKLDSSGSNAGPDKLDVLMKSVSELLNGAEFY